MEIKNIILCNDVINQPGQNGVVTPSIAMPYSNVVLPFIPNSFSFTAFVMIDGAPDVVGKFSVDLYKESSPTEIMSNVEIAITDETIKQIGGKIPASINFSINFMNQVFQETGKYIIDVSYNGVKLSSQSVNFYVAEKQ